MNEDVCGGRTPVQPDKEPMSLTSLMHQAVYGWLSLTGVGVEKVRDRNELLAAIITAIEFSLSLQLRGSFHSRCCRLAEEPH
jgi:hypothetical protein